ncbi:MAG: hypothetical protein WCX31_02410 [Salinivirgaceae bacterium]|jgi:hypothetical protein
MEYTSIHQKEDLKEIIFYIENIQNPVYFIEWCICLNVKDPNFQKGTMPYAGYYLKTWNIYVECGLLEIKARTFHNSNPGYAYGDDFHFYGSVFFNQDMDTYGVHLDEDIDTFIDDAIDFRNYITENLSQIEVSIEIWGNS